MMFQREDLSHPCSFQITHFQEEKEIFSNVLVDTCSFFVVALIFRFWTTGVSEPEWADLFALGVANNVITKNYENQNGHLTFSETWAYYFSDIVFLADCIYLFKQIENTTKRFHPNGSIVFQNHFFTSSST